MTVVQTASSVCCKLLLHEDNMLPCKFEKGVLTTEMLLECQAGVLGLTKTVAKEYAGRNITCNAIAPGFIKSDMTAAIDPKYEESILKLIPLGELFTASGCIPILSQVSLQMPCSLVQRIEQDEVGLINDGRDGIREASPAFVL